ncbi:hypothetical protein Tco_0201767 [Tanacetum coccineum]
MESRIIKKHSDVALDLRSGNTQHSAHRPPVKSVSEHVLEMQGLTWTKLHTLGKPYDNDMAVNLINRSLNKDFGDFVRNFNMHCVGKTKGRDNKSKPQGNKREKRGRVRQEEQSNVCLPPPNPIQRRERKILIMIKLVTTATSLGIGRGTALFISKSCVQIRRSLSIVLQVQTCPYWQDSKQKLQREGLLERYQRKESLINATCYSGKMTKKPLKAYEKLQIYLSNSTMC